MRWSGTPALIAEVARVACGEIQRDSAAECVVVISASSPAWESKFDDPQTFRERLNQPEELADIDLIEVEAQARGGVPERRRIAVSFTRPKTRRADTAAEPVVRVNVAGDDRAWTQAASAAMREVISRGVPDRRRWALLLLVGLSLIIPGFFLVVTHLGHVANEVGVILLVIGGVPVVVTFFAAAVLPSFELLAEGREPRRAALTRWSRREGGWLIRAIVAALIGSAITLLIQHL
jgi:hypothetical protein